MGEHSNRQRWSESFTDPSGAAFLGIVTKDVILEGSVFARPIVGSQRVWTTLRASASIYDTLTFTTDAEQDRRVYLEWSATALGMPIEGVSILALDDQNQFMRVAIHHRPLTAVLAFSAELGRRLAAGQGAIDG